MPGKRRRLPLMVSDSDPLLWIEARQREQLVEELDAIGLICDDPGCPAVHVDLAELGDLPVFTEVLE